MRSPARLIGVIEEAGGRAVDLLVGGLLLVIVAVTLAGVTVRYVIGGALPWGEELNLLLWVWMIQFGALRVAHIRIGLLADALPGLPGRAARLLAAALSAAALGLLTWGAARMFDFLAGDHYTSMPWLSERYAFLPLVIVGPLWIARIVVAEMRALGFLR